MVESHVLYKGLVTEQTSLAVNHILPNILKQINPANILEVGTAEGGLTTFLSDQCPESEILTIEILDFYNYNFRAGVTSVIGNVFSEEILSIASEFIKKPGICLVLCDGGNKSREFAFLANYLKVGDYIAAHDYCFSWGIFKSKFQNKIWNYCRITESHIHQICVNHSLENKFENSQEGLWIIKQKTSENKNNLPNSII